MCMQMEITRQPSMGQNPHIAAWRPPPQGTVKINYDAALDIQQGYVEWGLLLGIIWVFSWVLKALSRNLRRRQRLQNTL
jgi:hypothetical protein